RDHGSTEMRAPWPRPAEDRPRKSPQVLDELKDPPSSSRFCPTMKLIFAEHRNAHASPNSAGSPARPAGLEAMRSATTSSTERLVRCAASTKPERKRSVRN